MARNQSEIPVRQDVMDDLRLDPAKQATCSKPVNGVNIGCWMYTQCRLVKGRHNEKVAGAGPCNKGVTVIKPGMRKGESVLFNTMLTCFHIPPLQEFVEGNKGLVKIVASEGEELPMQTTRREPAKRLGDLDVLIPIVQNEVVPVYAPEAVGQTQVQAQLAKAMLEEGEQQKQEELLDSVKEEFGGRRKPGPKPKSD